MTQAQFAVLQMLSDGRLWDRRGVLSRTQWAVIGRLTKRGLVSQSVFHARITERGLQALEEAMLKDANSWYSSTQAVEIILHDPR